MIKKMICLLLTVLMITSLFACGSTGDESQTGDTTTSQQIIEEQEEPDVVINVADLSKYTVVRSVDSSDAVGKYTSSLLTSLNEKFSLNLEIKTDLVMENSPMFKESEYEILVGVCDREASASVADELKYLDYAYRAVGTKLVICAVSDSAVYEAIEHFKANVVEKSDAAADSVFFSNKANAYEYDHDYPLDDVKLNGVSIGEYTIISPRQNLGKEYSVAVMVRNRIRELTGFYLELMRDSSKKEGINEIHIGTISCDVEFVQSLNLEINDSYVGKNGEGNVLLTSNSPSGVVRAADIFVSQLEAGSSTSELEINSDTGTVKFETTEKLSVMTYNIQMWAPWTAGKTEATMQVIIDKNPDIFGVQESTLPQWGDILRNKFSDTYGCVDLVSLGVDALDYPITENSIFYRKDKFTLIESGNKWLTDTPDIASKFEDSAAIRTFIYAVLERKSDGLRFVFVNTHLDHVATQPEQAAVLVKYLERFSEYPILMIGDFNSKPSSEAYSVITNSGYLNAKYLCSELINAGIGTFVSSGSELDHCFFNGRRMYFSKYEVIKDATFNGTTPSDHYAVYLEFQFCN